MKKMSVTEKSAWISAAALIVSVLVTGFFALFKGFPEQAKPADFTSFLVEIPAGSRVTVLVQSPSEKEVKHLEAVFKKQVKTRSTLTLVEPGAIKPRLTEKPLGKSGTFDQATLERLGFQLEYIVLINTASSRASVVEVQTGQIIYSRTLPRTALPPGISSNQ